MSVLRVMEGPPRYRTDDTTRLTVYGWRTSDALRHLADWLDEHPNSSLVSGIDLGGSMWGHHLNVNVHTPQQGEP